MQTSKNKQQLASHPTFIKELAKALVMGLGYKGELSPSRWKQGAGGPGFLSHFKRMISNNGYKADLDSDGAKDYLLAKYFELEEKSRTNLWRFYYCHLSYEAWGEFFGKSPEWAKAQLNQSLDELRKKMDGDFKYDREKWRQALKPLAEFGEQG